MDDRDELHAQAQTANSTLQTLIARIGELIATSRALLARLKARPEDEQQPPQFRC
jgi:hypothetical protein